MRRRAPDVSDWAGDLYERCADDWRTITLDELRTAEWLRDGDGWISATQAQQAVSRRLARQGQGVLDSFYFREQLWSNVCCLQMCRR